MSLLQFLRDVWRHFRTTPTPAPRPCTCIRTHSEIGVYDPGCPVHDKEAAR